MRTVRKRGMMAEVVAAALVIGSLALPESVGVLDIGAVFTQAAETVDSGTCGDNLTWTLDDEGTLTISGTGEMTDYYTYGDPTPWTKDSIVSVIIESGVTYIGYGAFRNCTNLESVDMPEGLLIISGGAFYGCTALKSVDIPDSVTTISDGAFQDSGLETASIGDNIIDIDKNVFLYTPLDEDESNWEDGLFYLGTCLVRAKSGLIGTDCVIKEGTTVIANNLLYSEFQGNKKITSVTFPDSIVSIGKFAFYDCSNLANITIGDTDNIIHIGNYAFGDTAYSGDDDNWENGGLYLGSCLLDISSLAVENDCLIIKDGTTLIADRACDRPLDETSVIIPDSVKYIGYEAFNCHYGLKNIDIGENVVSIGECAFSTTAFYTDESNWEDGLLYLDDYLLAADSDVIGDSCTITEETKLIANGAFGDCTSLTDDQLSVADANGDGAVDSLDAILILRYDAGLIEGF